MSYWFLPPLDQPTDEDLQSIAGLDPDAIEGFRIQVDIFGEIEPSMARGRNVESFLAGAVVGMRWELLRRRIDLSACDQPTPADTLREAVAILSSSRSRALAD
jgi:hypothetical protein